MALNSERVDTIALQRMLGRVQGNGVRATAQASTRSAPA